MLLLCVIISSENWLSRISLLLNAKFNKILARNSQAISKVINYETTCVILVTTKFSKSPENSRLKSNLAMAKRFILDNTLRSIGFTTTVMIRCMKSLNFKLFCLEKIKNINFQRTGYLAEKWGFASALPKYVSKDYYLRAKFGWRDFTVTS